MSTKIQFASDRPPAVWPESRQFHRHTSILFIPLSCTCIFLFFLQRFHTPDSLSVSLPASEDQSKAERHFDRAFKFKAAMTRCELAIRLSVTLLDESIDIRALLNRLLGQVPAKQRTKCKWHGSVRKLAFSETAVASSNAF